MRRAALLALVVATLAAAVTGAAAAHIQILPVTVAPGDPTLFTMLVPNESDNPTVQVDLQIPPEVIPFGFEETPGWERTETTKPDGSLDVVTWKGSLPPGAFVRFSFVAAPPDQEGTIKWPAVQTYSDGTKVRWIGDEGSEEPSAITVVSTSAVPQNAGGEGAGAPTDQGATTEVEAEATETAEAATSSDSGSSTLEIVALVLGGAGLAVGLAALVLARRRPRA